MGGVFSLLSSAQQDDPSGLLQARGSVGHLEQMVVTGQVNLGFSVLHCCLHSVDILGSRWKYETPSSFRAS